MKLVRRLGKTHTCNYCYEYSKRNATHSKQKLIIYTYREKESFVARDPTVVDVVIV